MNIEIGEEIEDTVEEPLLDEETYDNSKVKEIIKNY